MPLSIDTILPADSVEFCPHPHASNIVVCGTYQLQEEQNPLLSSSASGPDINAGHQNQIRTGQCLVFEVDSEQEIISASKIQEISLPAVLDLKWCHTTLSRRPLMAVAKAEGSVDLFEWEFEQVSNDCVTLAPCAWRLLMFCACLSTGQIGGYQPGTGPLRMFCSSVTDSVSTTTRTRSTTGSLVVSLSDGTLSLLEPDQTSQLVITSTWLAHAHEPWCVAWSYDDPNVIYSGGDDLQLKVWDKRQGFEQPIITNKRFDAGVTCIQSHPNIEHLIAVGSYDATVRLFDSRKPLKPLSQADIGGGAWRVKWHPSPSRANDLLVAAMHDGFKVVRFPDIGGQSNLPPCANDGNWDIIKRYDEHKSLAYGVDWSYKSSQNQTCETLIASASFYDHALHIWRG